jgi:uncharacterized protein (UPF0332 family)
MSGREFLGVARHLLTRTTEADWRSALSRAYYAAFHVARLLLEDLGFTIPRADQAHAYLWLRLSNCGDPQLQLTGQKLRDLRGERNRADYDLSKPLGQTKAASQVRLAEQVIQLLDAGKADPVRSQIVATMRRYEQTVLGVVTWRQP